MHVPALRVFKVPGYKIALFGHYFFAYRANAAVLGVVRPAVWAAVYVHDAVYAFLGVELGLYQHARGKLLPAYGAAAYAHAFFANRTLIVFYQSRRLPFFAYGRGLVKEYPEEPEQESAYSGQGGGER
jgi:hypothetical protein